MSNKEFKENILGWVGLLPIILYFGFYDILSEEH